MIVQFSAERLHFVHPIYENITYYTMYSTFTRRASDAKVKQLYWLRLEHATLTQYNFITDRFNTIYYYLYEFEYFIIYTKYDIRIDPVNQNGVRVCAYTIHNIISYFIGLHSHVGTVLLWWWVKKLLKILLKRRLYTKINTKLSSKFWISIRAIDFQSY